MLKHYEVQRRDGNGWQPIAGSHARLILKRYGLTLRNLSTKGYTCSLNGILLRRRPSLPKSDFVETMALAVRRSLRSQREE